MVNIGNLNTNSERRGFSFIVFIAIIGFSLARGIANFYTNYLWFDSVGLESVWIKILLTRTGLVGATSLVAFIFIFTNLRLQEQPQLWIFLKHLTQKTLLLGLGVL